MFFDTVASEIFQILQSFDYTVKMYDGDGNQVFEPAEARRFWGSSKNILVSIIDNNDNTSIRLNLGKSTSITAVEGLSQTLRTLSTKYNMLYTVRRNGKINIKPSMFAVETQENNMNILEGMHGTSKSSYWKLEEARMIVRHSARVNENLIGSRGRNVKAIYIENAQGERFLFPSRQLSPARAMTQHVNHGGSFNDEIGEQILNLTESYSNLRKASNHINKNASKLSESAMEVKDACKQQMVEMRKCFERLARPGGYVSESAKIVDEIEPLNEDDSKLISLKEILVSEDTEDLEESVLHSISEAMRKCSQCVSEDKRTKETKYPKCQTCGGSGNGKSGEVCPSCEGSGVDVIKVCGYPVAVTSWNQFKAGVLALNGTVEMGDEPRFLNKDAELVFKLGQVISHVADDSMANFLGYVEEELQNKENNLSRLKSLRHVALHAIRLAGYSIDECANSEAVMEFAQWLKQFSVDNLMESHEDYYRMRTPSWPVADCYGIETYYCPECGTPEPDGEINRTLWDELGVTACEKCAPKLLADLDSINETERKEKRKRSSYLWDADIGKYVKKNRERHVEKTTMDESEDDKKKSEKRLNFRIENIKKTTSNKELAAKQIRDIKKLYSQSPLRINEMEYDEKHGDEGMPRTEENIAHAANHVENHFSATDFFNKSGSDFFWKDAELGHLEDDDLKYNTGYILRILEHYLTKKVEERYGFENVNMELQAEKLFLNVVEPLLVDQGYILSNDTELNEADFYIQTNQGVDLKREVEPPMSTDMETGKLVPTDTSYVNRLRGRILIPWNR